jgi:hypothetical protein
MPGSANSRTRVVALEHGRATVLSERFVDIRPYEARLAANGRSELANRFRQVSRQAYVEGQSDDELMDLARQREAILREIRDVVGAGSTGQGSFEDVSAAAARLPICYVVAATAGGMALIVDTDRSTRRLDFPGLGIEAVHEQFAAYQGIVHDRSRPASDRRAAVERICGWLGQVAIRSLSAELGGASRVALVPCGVLGMLPLHAGWWEANGTRHYAIEDRAWTFAPSARSLRSARDRGEADTADTCPCRRGTRAGVAGRARVRPR